MFTLREAKDAIKDKPEFSCKDKGSYSVIDYNLNTRETFVGRNERETMVLLNLRGTAFDNSTGKIIRLGFHKFFNHGEFPEKDLQLDFSDDHLVMQKLDGSFIAPIYASEGTVLGTRAGVTDVSKLADDFVASTLDVSFYDELIAVCREENITPMFELCSRKNRVVIDHPEDRLVLTGMREISTGEYFYHETVVALGEIFNVECVKVQGTVGPDFEKFKNSVSSLIDDEGVVIRFTKGKNTDHMLKLKAAQYVLQHKAIDQLKFAKDVLLLSLTGALDDVIPLLNEVTRVRVESFVSDFWKCYGDTLILIGLEYSLYSGIESQKDFAIAIKDSPNKSFMFGMRKGNNLPDMFTDHCKKQCGGIYMCDDLQKFLGMTVKY